MMEIVYLKGDATVPLEEEGNRIIAHICNDIGGWGKGFVLALSKHWKEPEEAYRKWYKDREENDFGLGSVLLVRVEESLHIANMVGQHGIKRSLGQVPIRYDSVRSCLEKLGEKALELGASVHMPRIGCGLAGGKWEEIEPIICEALIAQGVPVFVYDFVE